MAGKKTVTLQEARPGCVRARVDEWVFPLGEPVRDVPDEIVKRLKAIAAVQVHVAPSKRDTPEPTEEVDAA